MNLKDFVLANIVPDKYYQARFTNWNAINKANVICPWHNDKKPSLSICLNNGGAKCHACDKALANIVHFESQARDVPEEEAARDLYVEFIRKAISIKEVARLQRELASAPSARKVLLEECGLNDESIQMFKLGWEPKQQRITIPIYDRWSNCVNLRMYKMPRHRSSKDEAFKVLNAKSYGGCDLFPWPCFQEFSLDQPIFIMPSEKETMLGIQEGLQCVCATAGEQSWKEEWNQFFTGYDICIVAQRDKTGRDAAKKKLAMLQKVANRCEVIEPPTDKKDFADYVVMDGGTGLQLLALFREATPKTDAESPSFSDFAAPRIPSLYSSTPVPLSSIGSKPEMLNQVVITSGIVAAKATITYTIPWKFKVKIAKENQKFFTLELGRVLIGFVKASDKTIKIAVCELLEQEEAQVEPVEFINVTEVEIIPTAAVDQDVVYVTQRCLYVGERIDANIPYQLEIIPTNDVRTQETIGIVMKATPISRAMELRTFSNEDIAMLQIFRPAEETVYEKMHSVADTLAQHYTKIYNRPDWHLVALLTWLSPIAFSFPFEKEIQRGWLNSLALGDTQTGKSKVVQTLRRIFNAGTIINAENCTYVGLVGGAIKMGSGQFMLRWGRIPLCDKQLVVIEELSGLSIEEISNMSDVRSSGIARLDKGGLSAETNARTRLLALSNARPIHKNLAGYLSGVQAVRELIGHGEDIARFDLIITLIDTEVSVETINRPFSSKGLKEAIPESAYEKLCQFVWSLKPEQIKITTDAYYAVLEETKKLSEIYHAAVPIFKGGSGRYKIARIAAAIACLQFNWNGKFIMVTEEHIEAASLFLQSLYDKSSFGYREWSEQMRDRDGVKNTDLLDDKFDERIPNVLKRNAAIETLIHSAKFTRDELCAVASLQNIAADDLIGVMVRERVLRKGEANVWEITLAGKEYLKGKLKERPI